MANKAMRIYNPFAVASYRIGVAKDATGKAREGRGIAESAKTQVAEANAQLTEAVKVLESLKAKYPIPSADVLQAAAATADAKAKEVLAAIKDGENKMAEALAQVAEAQSVLDNLREQSPAPSDEVMKIAKEAVVDKAKESLVIIEDAKNRIIKADAQSFEAFTVLDKLRVPCRLLKAATEDVLAKAKEVRVVAEDANVQLAEARAKVAEARSILNSVM